MTKLCPRGKAAAKRKFKVYPSAYANAYASKICAGKIKDPSGVKRKDFRGRKPAAMGGPMSTEIGRNIEILKRKMKGTGGAKPFRRKGVPPKKLKDIETIKQSPQPDLPRRKKTGEKMKEPKNPTQRRNEDAAMKRESRLSTKIRGYNERVKRAGGGLMKATARLKKQGLKGGGMSSRGLGRAFMKGGRV